jgi:hypothetical protein
MSLNLVNNLKSDHPGDYVDVEVASLDASSFHSQRYALMVLSP